MVPPQLPVLPIAAQILAGDRPEHSPGTLDVAGAARAVDQSERRPDGMIAAQNEAVPGAAQDRLHPAPVSFDAGRLRIVEHAAMHGAPEVRIELEVGATPLLAHGPEEAFQMLLRFRMRSIKRVPRPVSPPAEGHFVCGQRRAVGSLDEPIRMLLK